MTKEERIELQKVEMEKFMEYFKNNQLNFEDTMILEKIKSSITEVFRLEILDLGHTFNPNSEENDFKLKFINDSNESFRGRYGKDNNDNYYEITYNIAHLCKGLESQDANKRLSTCKTLFKTVFHEIQHHRQKMLATSEISSKDGIRFARDFALQKYLEKDWYSRDNEKGNYDAYTLENNANEMGYRKYLEIMGDSDKEVTDLMHIEQGKFNMNRYKENIKSADGQTYYKSDGLKERDDVTVPILDDLICKRKKLDILNEFPILKKEYNLDGSKKTAIELIKNMENEIEEIRNIKVEILSIADKKILVNDLKEMYYEMIFRDLNKSTPEQINEIVKHIGKNESKELIKKISSYFQREAEDRLGKAALMASAQEKYFIMPSNDGTIEIEQNGKKIRASFDDFIKTIDPKLLEKNFMIPSGKNKGEMSAEKFIKTYFFGNLPQDGMVTLKNGRQISAKQYIENYALQMKDLKEGNGPSKFIADTMKSESSWEIQKESRKRIVDDLQSKKEILDDITQQISSYEPEQLDKKQEDMKWIKNFINIYDYTENKSEYEIRSKNEEQDYKDMIKILKNGNLQGMVGGNFNKIVRILKVAENISIEGQRNYVEELLKIPELREYINDVKNTEFVKNRLQDAKDNKINNKIPSHEKTEFEKDKILTENYLKSGQYKNTKEVEIEKRKNVVKESIINQNMLSTKNVDIGKTSLYKVLARQMGKNPKSNSLYNTIDFSTKKIKPKDLVDLTTKEKIGISEIQQVDRAKEKETSIQK